MSKSNLVEQFLPEFMEYGVSEGWSERSAKKYAIIAHKNTASVLSILKMKFSIHSELDAIVIAEIDKAIEEQQGLIKDLEE